MTEYRFFSDIGHGWLKVPYTELESLGIENTISEYSYRDSGFAYLEEDCDAYRFIEAKKKINQAPKIIARNLDGYSIIRTYPAYSTKQ